MLYTAFDAPPHPAMTPRAAFQRLMSGEVNEVTLDELEGRTAAVSIIPYPPGTIVVVEPMCSRFTCDLPTGPSSVGTHPPRNRNKQTGIPMVMSGEVLGPAQVAYLKAMEAFDRAFPGFEAEIQVRAGLGLCLLYLWWR